MTWNYVYTPQIWPPVITVLLMITLAVYSYRADQSRAHASWGSGLCLAIVKQLVEVHGGSVNVFSPVFTEAGQQGYGTRFTFTLPLASK